VSTASTSLGAGSAEGYRKVSSPYGFSMYDVEATAALEKASRAAQDILRSHGFERIMPAMVDFPETFAEGTHSEMFSMKDNSGERLALRNDITAQVIKGYVRQIESKAGHDVRRFFYAAPVYKDVRKNYPLPREIYQIGGEVVGEKAENSLPELISISQKILSDVFNLESSFADGNPESEIQNRRGRCIEPCALAFLSRHRPGFPGHDETATRRTPECCTGVGA
jgi:hypothetical protein